MDIAQMRNRLQTLANEMKTLAHDTPRDKWTNAHAQAFDKKQNEFDNIEAQLDRYQNALDNLSEDPNRRRRGAGANEADAQAAVAALGQFARTGSVDGFGVNNAALTEGADSGGIVVPRELADKIISTQRAYDPMRLVCTVVSSKTAATKYDVPLFNGTVDSGWAGETDPRAAGSISALESVVFPDAEIWANIPISAWLEEDSRIGDFVVREIAKEFARKEGVAFISGSGTKQPLGFLSSPQAATGDDTRSTGTVQTIASGGAAAILPDSLTDLVYSLRPAYRANATWILNSKTLATVRKMKDLQDNYLWQPSVIAGQPATLLGYPILECENMPDVAAGAIPIAIGDWKEAYHIVDRTQMLLRDPYTSRPNVLFYSRKRVSGSVVDSNALKLLKIGV